MNRAIKTPVSGTRSIALYRTGYAALAVLFIAACGGDSDDSVWVTATIVGMGCGDDTIRVSRILNTKTAAPGARATCYFAPFFGEAAITNYLNSEGIVPEQIQCGVIQTGPLEGASPFLPDRAYHFKVTGAQGRAMVDSGKFTTKEFYDQTEYFFELRCDIFGLVPSP